MPRHALLASLTLILLCACSSDGKREPTGEERKKLIEIHTESAQQYLNMGELDRAEGQTEKGLELDKSNPKLRLILGKTLLKRGHAEDLMRAEKVYRELDGQGDYQVTVGLAATLERLAILHRESAKDIRSGKHLTEAADPEKRAKQFEERAVIYLKESVTLYERSLKEKPDNIDGLNGLVRASALLGDDEASLRYAEKLIEMLRTDRKFWEASLVRPELSADEETRFRKLARAQGELEVAIHLHAASLLHKLGRDEKAIEHLDGVIELRPDLAEAYSRRAEDRMALKQYELAHGDLETYLRLSTGKSADDPDIKRAYQLLSDCMIRARDPNAGAR